MSINPIATFKQREAKQSAGIADEPRHATLTIALRSLHQVSVRTHCARGETIFNEGDEATHAYHVVSGVVRLCKYTLDGRRQIIDFLSAGTFFAFVKLEEHGFTAEAVTDVVLVSYPRTQIDRLEATMPGMHDHVSALISESLMTMQRHLVVLGCQTAKERVASFLLRLAEQAGAGSGDSLTVAMGRQDIADHLGLTIETVCRALSELKRVRLIAIPNVHQVILSNMIALHELADGGPCDEDDRAGMVHLAAPSRGGPKTYKREGSLLS